MSFRLEMMDIQKAFGPTQALGGISFAVRPGTVHALVGENGAGKSTLMKVLSGALRPDEGSMRLDGEPYQPQNPLQARASGISMIYQELSLAPHLTITENIFLGVEKTRGGRLLLKDMRNTAEEVMARAGLQSVSPDTLIQNLSSAQCQQVEVARALASGCKVLVLDEPTSSLTHAEISQLFALIRDWRSQGIAVIYISHFLEEVETIADDCTVMCDGKVIRSAQMAEWTREDMIRAMVGRDVGDLYPRINREPGDVVLTLETREGELEVRRGEIVGIAGLIGSGRTELLESIFGLRQIEESTLVVKGIQGPYAPGQRWQQGVGFLSEDRKRQGLATSLSITENMTLSQLPFWSRPETRNTMAEKWVEPLTIKCDSVQAPIHSLSGGNQQKVAIGRLLHHEADVWLLDEPTRGIDVGAKSKLYQVMNACTQGMDGRPPCAILVVSSYLPELLGICDRIAVMQRGKICAVRPRSEWTEHQLMEEAIQ